MLSELPISDHPFSLDDEVDLLKHRLCVHLVNAAFITITNDSDDKIHKNNVSNENHNDIDEPLKPDKVVFSVTGNYTFKVKVSNRVPQGYCEVSNWSNTIIGILFIIRGILR
jgi:hypothetical protein